MTWRALFISPYPAATWHTFTRRFLELWGRAGVREGTGGLTPALLFGADVEGGAAALEKHQAAYLANVLRDALGFAGAKAGSRQYTSQRHPPRSPPPSALFLCYNSQTAWSVSFNWRIGSVNAHHLSALGLDGCYSHTASMIHLALR
jgi:hypothetical protein